MEHGTAIALLSAVMTERHCWLNRHHLQTSGPFKIGEHLECDDLADLYESCKIINEVLSDVQDKKTKYQITYTFTCRGHPIYLGLRMEDTKEFQMLSNSTVDGELEMEGKGRLLLEDVDPDSTYTASLAKDCILDISVKAVQI